MMKKRTARDYKFIRLLGEGSFSSVYLAVDADVTSAQVEASDGARDESAGEVNFHRGARIRKYAIKVCQKSHIKRQGKQAAIMREKEIMNVLNQHPSEHFIRLHCTFQDTDRLYFVTTYAENGELLAYMQVHPLSASRARGYALQLVSALEHLHKLGIVHRDLKPENILLDDKMNLLVTDFGSAQINSDKDGKASEPPSRRNSFVGTAQYVSPEMLSSRQATNKSDLWALGVIIYQMITNVMPFNAPNEYLIYRKIQSLEYVYPTDFDVDARSLVSLLIRLEPEERLGALDDIEQDGYISIRQHEYFRPRDEADEEDSQNGTEIVSKNTDVDLANIDSVGCGLDESQLLRLLTTG